MFHIGVLAPSLGGAAALLRRFGAVEPARRASSQPELTLSWASLGDGSSPWQRADADFVRGQLALSVARLREAGAHFFVCPDDTAYVPLDEDGATLSLPGIHAASVVAAEAQRQGYGRLGILGTRWTLGSERYAQDLEPLGSGAVSLPLPVQTTLHSIIFDELARGRTSMGSRDAVLAMIDWLRRQGCQAVVLGCPELSELVTPASASLPLLETTTLLAGAALAVAEGEAPLPEWRGGPLLLAH